MADPECFHYHESEIIDAMEEYADLARNEERVKFEIAVKQLNRLRTEKPVSSWENGSNAGIDMALDILQSLFSLSEKEGRKEG